MAGFRISTHGWSSEQRAIIEQLQQRPEYPVKELEGGGELAGTGGNVVRVFGGMAPETKQWNLAAVGEPYYDEWGQTRQRIYFRGFARERVSKPLTEHLIRFVHMASARLNPDDPQVVTLQLDEKPLYDGVIRLP